MLPIAKDFFSDDCLNNVNGQVFYNGTRSFTVSGIECQRWDSDEPHVPKYRPIGRRHKNYCRNPDNDQKAWCYTTDPDVRWEYCDIQQCGMAKVFSTKEYFCKEQKIQPQSQQKHILTYKTTMQNID